MIILVLAARRTGDGQGGNFLNRRKGDDDETLLDNYNIKKSEKGLESIPPPKTHQNNPTIN